ncbi:MAG: TolC family protein [Bacteroidota bacterium]|nr:TolC family protein [Bacteroidota bacterium]
MLKNRSIFILLLWLIAVGQLKLQAQSKNLDLYLLQLESTHPEIIKARLAEQKSILGIKESRTYYLPDIQFLGSYTMSQGGRRIDLPVGDLLNPVYMSLNKLNNSNQFTTIENTSVALLPNNFHDIKFRITQALYRPELSINTRIKEVQLNGQQHQLQQVIRDQKQLFRENYFKYQQIDKSISIYESKLSVLQEYKRITEKLLQSGMALPSTLRSVDAQVSMIQAQKNKQVSILTNVRRYLNLALDRNESLPIEPEENVGLPIPTSYDSKNEVSSEHSQLEQGIQIQTWLLHLEKTFYQPKIGFQIDLGSQNYGFKSGPYVLGGLAVELPIWNSGRHKLKKLLVENERNQMNTQLAWLDSVQYIQKEQLRLSIQSEIDLFQASEELVKSYKEILHEVTLKYKQGVVQHIDVMNALDDLTEAEFEKNNYQFNSWIYFSQWLKLTQ